MPTPQELFDAAVSASEQLIAEAEASPIVRQAAAAKKAASTKDHRPHLYGLVDETMKAARAACPACCESDRLLEAASAAFPALVLGSCDCGYGVVPPHSPSSTAGAEAVYRLARR